LARNYGCVVRLVCVAENLGIENLAISNLRHDLKEISSPLERNFICAVQKETAHLASHGLRFST